MGDFVHLHTHSEYSLLDGLSKFEEMFARIKKDGQKALALTDHGNLYGAVKFYLEAQKEGIKPIIGMEAYMAKKNRFEKEPGNGKHYYHLILLCKNEKGYKNLLKLATIGYLEGFYYRPRIDEEVLRKYSEGLIASTACLGGEIPQLLLTGQDQKAEKRALRLAEIFGEGNFYLEIQPHPKLDGQEKANQKMIKLSRKLGLPLLATNDSHYTKAEDAQAQEILLCIQTQTTIETPNRSLSMIGSPDFYLKTRAEMKEAFLEYPEAIENTIKVAESCNLEIEMDKYIIPEYPDLPQGMSPKEFLRQEVEKGIKERYGKTTPEIKERMEKELRIIETKGYETYFLIFADFVKWASGHNIASNTRGSAAGSIVAYALAISKLDPLYYGLPFERFMHEFRPTPPDIDVDLSDNRRDEVIEYVRQKYGQERVAQIITFGRMEVRQALRDAGRALGMPYSGPDRLAKMVPLPKQGFYMTMDGALEESLELKRAWETESDSRRLIDIARKLVGVARHASVHAAGVVIADKKLTDYAPLQKDPKGEKIITQYDMYALDLNVSKHAIGLLKMDFLGIRHLSILQEAVAKVKKTLGQEIDLDKIPLDDLKTFKMLGRGETVGVFQLESSGMTRAVQDFKPGSVFDISAIVALYRPGPLQFIPDFIKRKQDPSTIKYLHPDLKPILEETYGIIVYQEQVMEIAHQLAGFTMAEADGFRKAIGKKKRDLMKIEGQRFIQGCMKKGYSENLTKKIYLLIERFAAYGFNKAHSASYALIAYKTAYMKANYPAEYLCAMLTAEAGAAPGPHRDAKLALVISEAKRMKIEVLPPDINLSQSSFSIETAENKKAIRFGLNAIKHVGTAAISSVLSARKERTFNSLADFCQRIDLQKVNRKTLESLIKAGAMDMFGSRASLLLGISRVVEEAAREKKKKASGQEGLFDGWEKNASREGGELSVILPEAEELPQAQLLAFEKELLGFYLTEDPLGGVFESLSGQVSHAIGDLSSQEHRGQRVKIGGVVTAVKQITTRKTNQEMAFVRLEDRSGQIELVVFPTIYSQSAELWQKDLPMVIQGRVDDKDDRLVVLVEEARKFEPDKGTGLKTEKKKDVEIELPEGTQAGLLQELGDLLRQSPGDQSVRLILKVNGSRRSFVLPFKIEFNRLAKERVLHLLSG